MAKKFNKFYHRRKRKAKMRGIEWAITYERFIQLNTNCYYCNKQDPLGLDRLDNSRGYIEGNVIPCCYHCNKTRGEFWSVEEAKAMIELGLKMRNKS